MNCANCGKEIAANSNFCYYCGSRQYAADAGSGATAAPPRASTAGRRLYRSRTDKMIGGVCGGLAEYFGWDSTVVRIIWVVLSIFPGSIIGGLLVYLVAWIVMSAPPEALPASPGSYVPTSGKRLTRSARDRKWAGVCGGIGDYLDVDPTIVRIVWVVLSIVPGAIIGGLVVYFIAWLVMPAPPAYAAPAAVSSSEPVPHSS